MIFLGLAFIVGLGIIAQSDNEIAYAPAAASIVPPSSAALRITLNEQGDIPMPAGVPSAHASSLVALSEDHPGGVAAFWFAGTRESAADVQIAFSFFDRKTKTWTPANFVVNRHKIAQQIGHGVRRLGNPVAWLDSSNRLHVFVVGTGLGGWAASRVVHLVQEGDPYDLARLRFKAKGTIPLSWFWNTSYLVRSQPLPLQDGGMVLPVYFEIGVKYPALAWYTPEGEFAGMRRISSRSNLLQPSIVAITDTHWYAFMRMKGGARKIAKAESLDAGRTWHDLPDLDLANPDAAVAALQIAPKALVMAHNPSDSSRYELALRRSSDGRNWEAPLAIESGQPYDDISYPNMILTGDSLWLSFTNRRKNISWQRFDVSEQPENE